MSLDVIVVIAEAGVLTAASGMIHLNLETLFVVKSVRSSMIVRWRLKLAHQFAISLSLRLRKIVNLTKEQIYISAYICVYE